MHVWKQKHVGVCFQKSISEGSCRNRHHTPSLGARETLRMNQAIGSDVETEESRGDPWCLWDVMAVARVEERVSDHCCTGESQVWPPIARPESKVLSRSQFWLQVVLSHHLHV